MRFKRRGRRTVFYREPEIFTFLFTFMEGKRGKRSTKRGRGLFTRPLPAKTVFVELAMQINPVVVK